MMPTCDQARAKNGTVICRCPYTLVQGNIFMRGNPFCTYTENNEACPFFLTIKEPSA